MDIMVFREYDVLFNIGKMFGRNFYVEGREGSGVKS